MSKKTKAKTRGVPERPCVVCREIGVKGTTVDFQIGPRGLSAFWSDALNSEIQNGIISWEEVAELYEYAVSNGWIAKGSR